MHRVYRKKVSQRLPVIDLPTSEILSSLVFVHLVSSLQFEKSPSLYTMDQLLSFKPFKKIFSLKYKTFTVIENTRSLELIDPLKEIDEQHQRHELNELELKVEELCSIDIYILKTEIRSKFLYENSQCPQNGEMR
ncbi:hypothetical protein BpHYR1_001304 [Brachionus plicatilis]|uniref:Uncharacterized protein n=1 Tax=Brachionus plicatilis TaxID=10195 RepID=A0A3M7T7K0_BRAPC|nr:hypothetical protein BpHYR1_001304 [Brachionus plicatilis]